MKIKNSSGPKQLPWTIIIELLKCLLLDLVLSDSCALTSVCKEIRNNIQQVATDSAAFEFY